MHAILAWWVPLTAAEMQATVRADGVKPTERQRIVPPTIATRVTVVWQVWVIRVDLTMSAPRPVFCHHQMRRAISFKSPARRHDRRDPPGREPRPETFGPTVPACGPPGFPPSFPAAEAWPMGRLFAWHRHFASISTVRALARQIPRARCRRGPAWNDLFLGTRRDQSVVMPAAFGAATGPGNALRARWCVISRWNLCTDTLQIGRTGGHAAGLNPR